MPAGTNNLTARLTDDVNDMVSSRPVAVIVNAAQLVSLSARLDPSGLALTWSGGTGPYTLQKKATLSDIAWADVVTTNVTTATVPLAGQSAFFRVTTP